MIRVLQYNNKLLKYAYASVPHWLMQVHLTFLSLSLTWNLIFYTWSPRDEWPLLPLGNSLLLRTKLVPIHEWQTYFSRSLYRSIPLKSGLGLAQVLDSTAGSVRPFASSYYLFHSCISSCVNMPLMLMHMPNILLLSILHAWSSCIYHTHTHGLSYISAENSAA